MMAPPGVGKSSIAKWIQSNCEDVVIVSKEKIENTKLFSPIENTKKYYENINHMLNTHNIVIANDIQITKEDREGLFNAIQKKNIKIIGIWIECSLGQALKANEENHHFPKEKVENDFRYKVSPTADEPFDNVIYLMRETDAGASKNNPLVRKAIDVLKEDLFLWR